MNLTPFALILHPPTCRENPSCFEPCAAAHVRSLAISPFPSLTLLKLRGSILIGWNADCHNNWLMNHLLAYVIFIYTFEEHGSGPGGAACWHGEDGGWSHCHPLPPPQQCHLPTKSRCLREIPTITAPLVEQRGSVIFRCLIERSRREQRKPRSIQKSHAYAKGA